MIGRSRLWLAGTILLHASVFAEVAPLAHTFRITGIAVSSRDGSPVPFCRLSANAVASPSVATFSAAKPGTPGLGGSQRGAPPQRQGGRSTNATPQSGETTADASGHFTLDLPHAGEWRLFGTARGFHSQLYQQHDSYTTGIILTEDAPAYSLTFRLTPDALIDGLVLDEAGEPVRMAQVVAELIPVPAPGQPKDFSAQQPRQVDFAQTDDRGRYELAGLAPGSYRVRVQAQPWYAANLRGLRPLNLGNTTSPTPSLDPPLDFVYAPTWFPAATSEQDAETFTLRGGEERQADFRLVAIPSVHLQVQHTDPPPPQENPRQPRTPQRMATITKVSGDGFPTMTSFVNGVNGSNWDFGGLSPGTYEIRIPGPDGQSDGEVRQLEIKPGTSGTITLENSTPVTRVTVALDGVNDQDISLVQFIDINSGRRIITNQPRRGRGGRRGDDEAQDDGEDSRSAMLPPGSYDVELFGRSGAFLTGIDAKGAQVVGQHVTIGTSTAVLTLHVADGRAELSGFVRAAAQEMAKPVPGAMVLLVPITLGQPGDSSTVQRDQSNTDGSFHLRNLIPGKYILLAIQDGWALDWSRADALSPYLLRGVPVELKSSQKATRELIAQQP